MNKEDILKRLATGDSIDSIAADYAKLLNEAEAEYKAELEAKAKEAEKDANQKRDAQSIADHLNAYLDTYVGCADRYSADDVIFMLSTYGEFSKEKPNFHAIWDSLFEHLDSPTINCEREKKPETKKYSDEDIFKAFFKKFNI